MRLTAEEMKRILRCFLISIISLSVYVSFALLYFYSTAENQPGRGLAAILSNDENAGGRTFYSNAENREPTWDMRHPDLSVLRAVFCAKLSEKYAVSSDGTVWMFADNYFVSFRDGRPRVAVRSVAGMKRGETCDAAAVMSSKELFCSTEAFSCETSDSFGALSAFIFHGTRDVSGDVLCLASRSFSSPVLWDFSRFFENREV